MKKLILDHLEHRLPANKAFMQYMNEEMHSNLIAFYSAFYPDSKNNAYILTGIEGVTAGNMINYSQGYVFYNKEIFFVPAFSISALSGGERPHGFVVSTTIIYEEYKSGQTLPAYSESILVFSDNVPSGPLMLANLIRKSWDIPFSKMEISIPGSHLEKKEAQVITNGNTQRLLMHLQVLYAASGISTGVRFQSVFSKKGFIGFGKAINKTTQRTFDVCVYQIGNFTLIKRPWDA
ncbi:MAG: hypothetical protein FWC34_11175, partial [Bacteroidetes bacterium]|nr:hypothetical protein [Bacteroidota bacterium]MCL2302896.1 hypothetical protein [Lentimicrobiaceae bacterium]